MSIGTVFAVVGVVGVVAIVGIFAFRPNTTTAPTPTPSPIFEDIGQNEEVSVIEVSSAPSETEQNSSALEGATENSDATSEVVTVSIDETGFTPSTVAVATGTTVMFVNNGQAKHWPASDVHPTHEILPEFDAKRGLETGETYSYVFTKPGTWSMHDHLFPSATGTITVE